MRPEFATELHDLAHELVALARSAYPFETCGVVLKNWTWVELTNVSKKPMTSFEISDEDTILWFGHRRDEVLGIFHTHPQGNASPSLTDREHSAYPDLRYFIATRGDMYEWSMIDGGPYAVDADTGTSGTPQLALPILGAPVQIRQGFGDTSEAGG